MKRNSWLLIFIYFLANIILLNLSLTLDLIMFNGVIIFAFLLELSERIKQLKRQKE